MNTRRIGTLDVSVMGIGCNNFGRRLDASATAKLVSAALDVGINFFGTADIYGSTKSEEFLGLALRGRRDEVVTRSWRDLSPSLTHESTQYWNWRYRGSYHSRWWRE